MQLDKNVLPILNQSDKYVQPRSNFTTERDHFHRPLPFRQNPYHQKSFKFDNTGDPVRNGYGNLNIMRRHSNIQKGVKQNGIGNKNIQKDELSWRYGKLNTADVQENVNQNGIGEMNDKSLRRIRDKNNRGHGHRKNNTKKQEKLFLHNGNLNQAQLRRENPIDIFKKSTQAVQAQMNVLSSMLCKSIPSFCSTNDRPTRRVMNKIGQDNITQIGDRNVNSQMSVIQNTTPSKYNRRHPSIIDEYDEIIFIPNYQIVLK